MPAVLSAIGLFVIMVILGWIKKPVLQDLPVPASNIAAENKGNV
jgi:hypothetical protein